MYGPAHTNTAGAREGRGGCEKKCKRERWRRDGEREACKGERRNDRGVTASDEGTKSSADTQSGPTQRPGGAPLARCMYHGIMRASGEGDALTFCALCKRPSIANRCLTQPPPPLAFSASLRGGERRRHIAREQRSWRTPSGEVSDASVVLLC